VDILSKTRQWVLELQRSRDMKTIVVNAIEAGERIDLFLSRQLNLTRNKIIGLIKSEKIFVNGKLCKASNKVKLGDRIEADLTPVAETKHKSTKVFKSDEIPFKIIFEDKDIMVIDKPPGLVVHPGNGTKGDTLVDYLRHEGVKRWGIVHRLDKDTSGVMVIAKNENAQHELEKQIQNRSVYKEYRALVLGKLSNASVIDAPIIRHRVIRTKMTTTFLGKGRVAHTEYKVINTLSINGELVSFVSIIIKTGRTHQIRVHFNFIGHPVIGDMTYGNKKTQSIAEELGLKRQFLHAHLLRFSHPITNQLIEFESFLPEDLQVVLDKLKEV